MEICFIRVKSLKKADRAPYGARPGIGRCYHIQTPAGACTKCDHAKKKRQKSSDARANLKIAGDLQIAEIVRRHFYL